MFWKNIDYLKIIHGALILLLVVVFQSLFFEPLRIANTKLDLPLLLVVYISLTRGAKEGVIFGFSIGLLVDVLSPYFLGLNALTKTLLGYLVGNFRENLFVESIYFKGLVIFLALILNDLLYYMVYSGFDIPVILGIVFFSSILSGIYTSGIGMLIFLIKKRFKLKIAF
jgi:rod shape-determining protein MreD